MNEKVQKQAYLVTDGRLYKIGQSVDPVKRVAQLRTANPACKLVCYGNGVTEKYLHQLLFKDRIEREWFQLDDLKIENVKRLLEKGEKGRVRGVKPVYETVEIGGVLFRGRKRIDKGRFYGLSDAEKKRNADGRRKVEEMALKYVINFGKYNGKAIIDMISDEEYDYCVWLFEQMKSKMGRGEKRRSRKYKAFSWRVRNKNYHIEDE